MVGGAVVDQAGLQDAALIEQVLAVLAAGMVDSFTAAGPVAPVRPMSVAQSFVQQENARLQQRMLNFTPEEQKKIDEFNRRRTVNNSNHQIEIDKLQGQIQAIQQDPKLNAKQKAAKVKGLQQHIENHKKQMFPLLDAVHVTAEIERIMQDPNIPEKKKKEHIEKIRKKYDIPNHGPRRVRVRQRRRHHGVSMHEMFTGRMAGLKGESADNIKKQKDAHVKELGAQYQSVAANYGPDSAEAAALLSEINNVNKTYEVEEQRLRKEQNQLHQMYKRPKKFLNFLKKFWKFFEMIMDYAMIGLRFIPGVGQIIGAAWAGVKTVVGFVKGEGAKALRHLAGAVPVVGGVIAGAIGTIGEKVVSIGTKVVRGIKAGVGMIRSGIKKDIGGVLSSAASFAGSFAQIPTKVIEGISHAARGVNIIDRAARQDWAGAVSAAGSFAGGLGAPANVATILDHTAHGVNVVDRLARKDWNGAINGVSGLAGSLGGNSNVDARVGNILQHTAQGGHVVERLAHKDFSGALAHSADLAGGLSQNDRAETILGHTAQGVGVVESAARGDIGGALAKANSLVANTTGFDLIGEASDIAREALDPVHQALPPWLKNLRDAQQLQSMYSSHRWLEQMLERDRLRQSQLQKDMHLAMLRATRA